LEKDSPRLSPFVELATGAMERHGLTPGQETAKSKRVNLLKGLSDDGKRELRLEVSFAKSGRTVFQLNYVVSKK